MIACKIYANVLVGLVVLALSACGGGAPSKLPARSVSVDLTEFTITPGDYAAKVGEPLTFVITNSGVLDHDLTIVNAEGKQFAQMTVKPGQAASFDFQPATAAEFQLLCSMDGHAKAGMSAQMIVEP